MDRYLLSQNLVLLLGTLCLSLALNQSLVADDCCSEQDDSVSYGPCDCEPRGTLMQWSYGTSFSGGPDLDEPLVTDRPDFTEAAVTVGRGVTQLEFGYRFISDDAGPTRTESHSYPELLVRQGILAEWLELRVVWNYAHEETRTGLTTTRMDGADDLGLGLKIALTPQEGILPEMALIPQMTVPTGGRSFSANEVLPGLIWVYSWEVNDFLSIGASTQGNRAVDDVTGDGYFEIAQSVAFGYSLTDRLGAFTEWYAFFPHSADTALPEHVFDGGFTYLINDNFQLDISAGVGLNNAADDFFVATGAVVRF
ncbi:MAG: transporter [Pirellulales bacterium]